LVLTRYGGSAGDPVRLRPHSKALLYREHLSPTIGRRRWPVGVSVLRK
jgi:hypothetical protein